MPSSVDDKLLVAINRLSLRIVRESGGQAECDKLEAELTALYAKAGIDPSAPLSASRHKPKPDEEADDEPSSTEDANIKQ